VPESLHILLVEDSVEDAQLLTLHLQAHGVVFNCTREDSLEGFLAALGSATWDLVLSDFSLRGTDGMEILKCLRDLDPDLPFILLSGVLDEGAAVAAMRAGANDFLLKGNLSRLVPAIEREMKEAELRRKQRQFEEELRLLHTAIGQTPDMVVITDPEGSILYVNAATEVISGYSRAELLGQNPRLFKSGQHDEGFYRSMWEVLLRGATWKGHVVNCRKDAVLWDSELVISPIHDAQGVLQNYLCTARDITLERQLQGLLEQSQRLETIGTLTSGIAHDFNNILMPVLGHAELGLERALGDPRVRHDLEVILTSANRARDLVRQILTFSRKGTAGLVAIEVQSLLAESLNLLRSAVSMAITFDLELDARDRLVLGDPTQLHQVILNLCTNASHAMQGQAGRLTVRLGAEQLPPTPCAMNILLPEGDYLCLEVTDTGKGIEPNHLDKIFLPFFTTKAAGEGTGLGLSVSHGIVSTMGGGIQVASQPGVGTTFKVFLPILAPGTMVATAGEEEAPRGQGHILLVDDEEALLRVFHSSLAGMGFHISSYRHPEGALRAFLRDPGGFQVLVTDHAMPGLSGVQLAEAVWAVNPAFPVILLTGSPDHGQTPAARGEAGFLACVAKPIGPKDLAKAILQVLPAMNRRNQADRP
jgi:PAS domain S-box-containing protein